MSGTGAPHPRSPDASQTGTDPAPTAQGREQRILPLLMATLVGAAIDAATSWPLFFGAPDRAAPTGWVVVQVGEGFFERRKP